MCHSVICLLQIIHFKFQKISMVEFRDIAVWNKFYYNRNKIFCSLSFICFKMNFPLLNFFISWKTVAFVFGPIWTKFFILEHLFPGTPPKISLFCLVSKMVSYNILAPWMHKIFVDFIETRNCLTMSQGFKDTMKFN